MNDAALMLWLTLWVLGKTLWAAVDLWLSWGPGRERAGLREVCGG